MLKSLITLILIVILACVSCNPKQSESKETESTNADSSLVNNDLAEVKTMVLHYTPFNKEVLSNGKLVAFQKADLKFRSTENVATVLVKNGDRVTKGQVIAQLDDFSLANSLKQTRDQFEKARIELQDVLIGQGYSLKDTALVPHEIVRIAKVKSGYDKASADLEVAEYNLRSSTLRSPFNGVVANLFSKENNLSATSDKFCTIIDDSRFEAEFPVLETELASLHKGQKVKIMPFAFTDFLVEGEVREINPVVDANGMLKVKALCNNPGNKLTEGMNVKIVIQDQVSHQLVIPREALVLRSGKQVVFTFSGGLAKWKYVKTGLENTGSFSVNKGLATGDTVIYEGNLNLAHDSRVKVIK